MTNTLEKQLEMFRVAYHSKRCYVGSDNILYNCNKGFSDIGVKTSNALIEKLGLDLCAIGTTLPSRDSYVIKSIYSSDL